MSDKTFLGFILNRFSLIGGIIFSIGFPLFTYIKKGNFYQSLSICLSIVSFILLLSLISMFKNLNSSRELFETKKNEIQEINRKYEELNQTFISQSENYSSNITEINKYKEVANTVIHLLGSEPPETKEGKRLISLLSSAVENSFKERD